MQCPRILACVYVCMHMYLCMQMYADVHLSWYSYELFTTVYINKHLCYIPKAHSLDWQEILRESRLDYEQFGLIYMSVLELLDSAKEQTFVIRKTFFSFIFILCLCVPHKEGGIWYPQILF